MTPKLGGLETTYHWTGHLCISLEDDWNAERGRILNYTLLRYRVIYGNNQTLGIVTDTGTCTRGMGSEQNRKRDGGKDPPKPRN